MGFGWMLAWKRKEVTIRTLYRVFLARLHREAQIAGRLGRPHINTVHDFGAGDEPYIVIEYFVGSEGILAGERE
jgi:serine/threonine protein kinase